MTTPSGFTEWTTPSNARTSHSGGAAPDSHRFPECPARKRIVDYADNTSAWPSLPSSGPRRLNGSSASLFLNDPVLAVPEELLPPCRYSIRLVPKARCCAAARQATCRPGPASPHDRATYLCSRPNAPSLVNHDNEW